MIGDGCDFLKINEIVVSFYVSYVCIIKSLVYILVFVFFCFLIVLFIFLFDCYIFNVELVLRI